ncbi:MAG: MBL fold metallo-hydrolase [Butyricicoccaceae bacterium]
MAEHYYYSIASGSSGNCGLYMADGTAILIDLGVSLRRITTALKALSLTLEDISAVVLTHEHIDHVKGLPMFLKKAKAPVFATRGTAEAFEEKNPEYADRLNIFDSGERFWVRDVDVVPFQTPHDEPSTGCIFEHGGSQFGFATDLGFVPRDAAELLRGCEMVVLRATMTHTCCRPVCPYSLKMRVAGPSGHLSNPDCAVFAADLVKSGTRTLVLAHLSEKNNMPELARQQTLSALRGLPACEVLVAPKEHMEHPVSFGEEKLCSLSG